MGATRAHCVATPATALLAAGPLLFAVVLMMMGILSDKPRRPMTDQLARYVVLTTTRGVLLVAYGLACFAWPDPTPQALLRAFALFGLADGLAAIIFGYGAALPQPIVGGALAVIMSVVALGVADASSAVLTIVVVTATLVRGLSDLSMAQLLTYAMGRGRFLRASGIASLLFAAAMIGALVVAAEVRMALIVTYAWFAGGSLLSQSVSTCFTIVGLEPRIVLPTASR